MTQNNYTIVQSVFEDDETYLCTLPSTWVIRKGWNNGIPDKLSGSEGSDMCYWPKKATGYRLLVRAKKNPALDIDPNFLAAFRCKIKRSGFQTYREAYEEQKRMEVFSDTDEHVTMKKKRIDSSAADLFSAIQKRNVSASGSGSSSSTKPPEFTCEGQQVAKPPRDIIDSAQTDFQCSSGSTRVDSPLKVGEPTAIEPCTKCQTLDRFEDRLHRMEKQLDQCLLLSKANAKIDVMSTRKSPDVAHDHVELHNFTFQPVKCLTDLESTEKKCKDENYVMAVVRSLGKIHGKHRFTGQGWTVCLQVIDYFLDRKFLRDVSWTGVSKTKSEDGEAVTKIAFSKYDGFINLFYQVVSHTDEQFSLESCNKFFKQCIRNSKQRLEEIKQVRASVARKRRLPKILAEVHDVEDNSEEAGIKNENDEECDDENEYSQIVLEEYLDEDAV